MSWRRQSDPDVEAALARVRIFASLPRRDLRRLSAMCLLKQFDAGDVILEEGTTGLGLFLITAGQVEVYKARDGRRIQLAVLGQGEVLGEMALLDDEPRSASAVALAPTDTLLLSRGRFRTLVHRRPRIAWPIVPALAARVRDQQAQLLAVEARAPLGPESSPPGDREEAEAPASQATDESAERPAAAAGHDGDETDPLRAPYALWMSGATGFGESLRLFEVFLRSLEEESGLSGGRPMSEVALGLPASLYAAGLCSWDAGRKVPSKVLDSFRDHLRRGGG